MIMTIKKRMTNKLYASVVLKVRYDYIVNGEM